MTIRRSVHDNELRGYTVDHERCEIVLRTVFRDIEPPEFTDIRFTGVVGYHFEGDVLACVLFDVVEKDVAALCAEYEPEIASMRQDGWPETALTERGDLPAWLRQRGVKGFRLDSSLGMRGFVLAWEMVIEPATDTPET